NLRHQCNAIPTQSVCKRGDSGGSVFRTAECKIRITIVASPMFDRVHPSGETRSFFLVSNERVEALRGGTVQDHGRDALTRKRAHLLRGEDKRLENDSTAPAFCSSATRRRIALARGRA